MKASTILILALAFLDFTRSTFSTTTRLTALDLYGNHMLSPVTTFRQFRNQFAFLSNETVSITGNTSFGVAEPAVFNEEQPLTGNQVDDAPPLVSGLIEIDEFTTPQGSQKVLINVQNEIRVGNDSFSLTITSNSELQASIVNSNAPVNSINEVRILTSEGIDIAALSFKEIRNTNFLLLNTAIYLEKDKSQSNVVAIDLSRGKVY